VAFDGNDQRPSTGLVNSAHIIDGFSDIQVCKDIDHSNGIVLVNLSVRVRG